uniref:Expressed protein n=1 Tax=Oryza sativa subsp. japonica TaxID=39947 RepID=Q10GL0_ORYSJ|nr:expressed protein [Oryza sativa Japonica Group]
MATTAATAPDLSLHISPPSPPDMAAGGETMEQLAEPKLCLGFGTAAAAAAEQYNNGGCNLQHSISSVIISSSSGSAAWSPRRPKN